MDTNKYPDSAACMTMCAGFSESGFSCRTQHLGFISSPDPTSVHCGHAGPTGGGVCN